MNKTTPSKMGEGGGVRCPSSAVCASTMRPQENEKRSETARSDESRHSLFHKGIPHIVNTAATS